MATDAWNPEQYDRFAAERRLPFDELVDRCRSVSGGVVYDLGCGPGVLTAELADRLDASLVVGIDSSEAMLAKAQPLAKNRPDLRFEPGDLAMFGQTELDPPPSLILSNAALHWVAHHHEILARWRRALAPGGQLAFQVPCNHDHPAYELATTVADEHAEWFPQGPPALPSNTVLSPEHYAQILHGLGATEQHVALRVFTHELDGTGDVVEWLKGTTLLPFRNALGTDDRFDEFCETYRERLVSQEGVRRPYLFTFKRILAWARYP